MDVLLKLVLRRLHLPERWRVFAVLAFEPLPFVAALPGSRTAMEPGVDESARGRVSVRRDVLARAGRRKELPQDPSVHIAVRHRCCGGDSSLPVLTHRAGPGPMLATAASRGAMLIAWRQASSRG